MRAHPVEPLADLVYHLQPHPPVGVTQINVLTPITARSDVVKTASQFKS